MRYAIAAVLLFVLGWCVLVLFQPKELFCDNGQISGSSREYLKNEGIVVLQYPSGKIQAFRPNECR